MGPVYNKQKIMCVQWGIWCVHSFSISLFIYTHCTVNKNKDLYAKVYKKAGEEVAKLTRGDGEEPVDVRAWLQAGKDSR